MTSGRRQMRQRQAARPRALPSRPSSARRPSNRTAAGSNFREPARVETDESERVPEREWVHHSNRPREPCGRVPRNRGITARDYARTRASSGWRLDSMGSDEEPSQSQLELVARHCSQGRHWRCPNDPRDQADRLIAECPSGVTLRLRPRMADGQTNYSPARTTAKTWSEMWSENSDHRCPIQPYCGSSKVACLRPPWSHQGYCAHSTSWGSLVRAQYRPHKKGPQRRAFFLGRQRDRVLGPAPVNVRRLAVADVRSFGPGACQERLLQPSVEREVDAPHAAGDDAHGRRRDACDRTASLDEDPVQPPPELQPVRAVRLGRGSHHRFPIAAEDEHDARGRLGARTTFDAHRAARRDRAVETGRSSGSVRGRGRYQQCNCDEQAEPAHERRVARSPPA
jgi:hypothetical protein